MAGPQAGKPAGKPVANGALAAGTKRAAPAAKLATQTNGAKPSANGELDPDLVKRAKAVREDVSSVGAPNPEVSGVYKVEVLSCRPSTASTGSMQADIQLKVLEPAIAAGRNIRSWQMVEKHDGTTPGGFFRRQVYESLGYTQKDLAQPVNFFALVKGGKVGYVFFIAGKMGTDENGNPRREFGKVKDWITKSAFEERLPSTLEAYRKFAEMDTAPVRAAAVGDDEAPADEAAATEETAEVAETTEAEAPAEGGGKAFDF